MHQKRQGSDRERIHWSDRRDIRFSERSMPYMSPLEVTAALRQRLQARRERRWIRELLSYDDHLLADLGFSRETLLWALKLPPEVNAGTVIGKLQLDAAAKLRLSIKDIR